MAGTEQKDPVKDLVDAWRARWEDALAAWSRFTKLAEPRWCLTEAQEKNEQLSGSFAMIRFVDHAVVISLRQVHELGLDAFATPILAHEVGHHVLAPGDLRDNARLLVRIRAGLPSRERQSGMVANMYTDLLINDRLQRSAQLDMAAVYAALRRDENPPDKVWVLYMRIYEILWGLQTGTLVAPCADRAINADAVLGAKVIRVYGREWLRGAGRFALLLLPYLLEIDEPKIVIKGLSPWMDTSEAGKGDEVPDGLIEVEADETPVHPSEDPAITGGEADGGKKKNQSKEGDGVETIGGIKNPIRSPADYIELMKGIGVKVSAKSLVIRYYRELAIPLLVRFPAREMPRAVDPYPEGVETWEPGDPVAELDWSETLSRGPYVIPGVTTVRRIEGASPGQSPEKAPLDLYIGIDCSGSMRNPAVQLSYPVLAGTVITVSALRAGARVMACLSGEDPGKFCETAGFIRSETEVLGIMTNYLGTGYSFGIERLKTAFLDGPPPGRPTHILVVSDSDMFYMLDRHKGGWDIARTALEKAGGGGTFVLEVDPGRAAAGIAKMHSIGWNVYTVRNQAELLTFARGFSNAHYGKGR